jgi:RHS repeat-associated protein
MAGRTVTGGYRYGFNAMEREDDLYAPGSAYDFGARMYDGRLGRWWSVDKATTKYPSVSPYVFTICNPILFVDYDGNDFGVYVNHETKTIIIRAVYIAIDKDVSDATSAAKHWTDTNGRFEYQFEDENGDQVVYNIQIELEVVPASSIMLLEDKINDYSQSNVRDLAVANDEESLLNTYMVSDEGMQIKDHGKAEPNDRKGGVSDITVKKGRQRQRKTGSHEMGHTLGLGHWSLGLMKDGEHRTDAETRISTGMISAILQIVGIGTGSSSSRDVEVEPLKSPVNHKREDHGDAPANFESGKVIGN